MLSAVYGGFGVPAITFIPFFFRLGKALLTRGQSLRGRGTLRFWLGAALVPLGCCALAALCDIGHDNVALGGAAGHALARGLAALLGMGAAAVTAAVVIVALPWYLGGDWPVWLTSTSEALGIPLPGLRWLAERRERTLAEPAPSRSAGTTHAAVSKAMAPHSVERAGHARPLRWDERVNAPAANRGSIGARPAPAPRTSSARNGVAPGVRQGIPPVTGSAAARAAAAARSGRTAAPADFTATAARPAPRSPNGAGASGAADRRPAHAPATGPISPTRWGTPALPGHTRSQAGATAGSAGSGAGSARGSTGPGSSAAPPAGARNIIRPPAPSASTPASSPHPTSPAFPSHDARTATPSSAAASALAPASAPAAASPTALTGTLSAAQSVLATLDRLAGHGTTRTPSTPAWAPRAPAPTQAPSLSQATPASLAPPIAESRQSQSPDPIAPSPSPSLTLLMRSPPDAQAAEPREAVLPAPANPKAIPYIPPSSTVPETLETLVPAFGIARAASDAPRPASAPETAEAPQPAAAPLASPVASVPPTRGVSEALPSVEVSDAESPVSFTQSEAGSPDAFSGIEVSQEAAPVPPTPGELDAPSGFNALPTQIPAPDFTVPHAPDAVVPDVPDVPVASASEPEEPRPAFAVRQAPEWAPAFATQVPGRVQLEPTANEALTPPPPAPPPVTPAPQAAEVFDAPHAIEVELPGIDLLAMPSGQAQQITEQELTETAELIERRLKEFKVPVTVIGASAGPVITRFEVEPAVGVRGSQIVGLMKDLSRGLGLTSIRVVETIPGKTCMGLELPNPQRQMIRLSEVFQSPAYQDPASFLTIALGKDITGNPVVTDLARAPHMLVAGTTGSGKSVAINAMILSLLYKARPEDVRLIMIDPKMLELSVYEGIPHLLAPVVTDMKLAANALTWCVAEMEKRYRLMSALGVRNLAGFNQKIHDGERAGRRQANPFSLTPDAPEPLKALPLIVVVIDELADLMMVAGKKIEELIARLAQKARASGIHLILATQRPSVDVITGLIKANIPTRVAFQVSSKIDSRTILDQMGAESLLGQGDMLFLPPGTGYPQRVHGAFVADDEVHRVVEYLKQFGEPEYEESILAGVPGEGAGGDAAGGGSEADAEADPLYDEAVAFVVRSRRASISSVQRQLRIGYNRAARLVEQMETAGLVSAMGINGTREVLAAAPME